MDPEQVIRVLFFYFLFLGNKIYSAILVPADKLSFVSEIINPRNPGTFSVYTNP